MGLVNIPYISPSPLKYLFRPTCRNIGDYARSHGKQLVVQPTFSKNEERFRAYDTLRSAAIAAVRAGNEWSVRYAKQSKLIKNGLKPNDNCTRLCDIWICWGFQVNFMFRPVH
jgi:hypothetical protein